MLAERRPVLRAPLDTFVRYHQRHQRSVPKAPIAQEVLLHAQVATPGGCVLPDLPAPHLWPPSTQCVGFHGVVVGLILV